MTDRIETLRAVAMEVDDGEAWFSPGVVCSYSSGLVTAEEDAHIAAFNPKTALALLAVAQAAKAALPRVDDLFGEQSALRAALEELEKQ